MILELVAGFLIVLGLLFFMAGSIGMLRLPDTLSRLHAVTKADNLGLGLLCSGIALLIADPWIALKLLLIWLLVLAGSAVSGQLIAARTQSQKDSR